MKAMLLSASADLTENSTPLTLVDVPRPEPGPGEVLIRVSVCGVCHTELDEIEGRLPPPRLPIILGHQVVGTVTELGHGVSSIKVGTRVGVAWIFSACGKCAFCLAGNENLCPDFHATGRDANGGYAEYLTAPVNFVHQIPDELADSEAAPLLCAGAIGYRSLRLANIQPGQVLGLTGFGASAHLVIKLVRFRWPDVHVFVFARSPTERAFALELGAEWAGETSDIPPEPLDSIIDTTPVWSPVLEGLRRLKPGGRLVINAIRKEETDKAALLNLDYPAHLWLEKEIKSVANVTRADVREFLEIARLAAIKPEIQEYPLKEANKALIDLKHRKIRGAKVLRITET
jgi:propanol-preferring alcohol dehydrogenase